MAVPQGKSVGKYEVPYQSPKKAASNIKKHIEPLLIGRDAANQEAIDKLLDKQWGANAVLGVSGAVAKAAAKSRQLPLWRYIRGIYGNAKSSKRNRQMSLYMNLIEGGVHAANRLLVQEHLVVFQERLIAQSLAQGQKFYRLLKQLVRRNYKEKVVLGDEGGFALPTNNPFAPFDFF